MKTTLNIDDELLDQARGYTGVNEKTRLVHMGLELLVQQEAARRLSALGGISPTLKIESRLKRTSSK